MRTTPCFVKIVFLLFAFSKSFGQVAIGTTNPAPTPSSNAVLLLVGDGKQGLVIPVGDRNSVPSPAKGMLIYDSNQNQVYFYNGSAWTAVGGSAGTQGIQISGNLVSLNSTAGATFPLASNAGPTLNQNGQLLSWSQTNQRWEATTSSAIADGNVLTWNGTTNKWEPRAIAGGGITSITGTNPINVTAGSTPVVSLTPISDANVSATANIAGSKISPTFTTGLSAPTATITGTTTLNGVAYTWPGTSTNGVLTNTAGVLSWAPASGSGTVTSVGLTLPSIFTVAGSPITTSGTLNATLAPQTPNTVFAAPSGSAGAPTFRALTASDIPSLSASQITSGTLPVSVGGTGATTLTGLLVGNGTSAFTAIPTGTNGQVLTVNAGAPSWQNATTSGTAGGDLTGTYPNPTISAGAVTSSKIATGAVGTTNIAASAVDDGKIANVAPGKILQASATNGQVLKWNGTAWAPATDAVGGGGAPTLSPGQIIVGDGSTNSGATMSLDATLNSTNGNVTVQGLQGRPISTNVPVNNSVYQFNGTQWTPVVLSGGGTVTNIATGAGLTGGPITSTGTISIAAGGVTATELAAAAVGNTNIAANAINSSQIIDGTINDADISGTAAIAVNKLATGTNGQVLTVSAGVPSWQNASGLSNPMSAAGDLIYGGVGGTPTRLATGTGFLKGGATPTYSAVGLASTDVTGVLPIANGGTGAATAPLARTSLGLGSLATLSNVTSTEITDGTIVDADISGTAAIAGTKVSPSFGAQNILTTGTLTTGTAGAFSVDATGNITKIRNVSTSFPPANGTGVLTNDGTGTLTWATSSGWGLTGNAGTNPASNFIGTTDAQPLRFATGVGGVERMRLDATGNLGFGITTPLSKFHIKQSVQVNDVLTDVGSGFFGAGLMFENGGTSDAYYMGYGWGGYFRIGSKSVTNVLTGIFSASPSGVGIFTSTAATEKLDVNGNVKFSGALMPNNLPGTAGQVLTSAGPGLPPTWAPGGSGWGLTGNSGTNPLTNFIGTTDAQPLRFATGVGGTERMRIDATGNLGIGITAPTSKLHVEAGKLLVNNIAGGIEHTNAGVTLLTQVTAASANVGTFTNHPLNFYTNNGSAALTIGTGSPINVTANNVLNVTGELAVDNTGLNAGAITNSLHFGSSVSGEAIGSRRTTGTNQFGLDFYTASTNRMTITNGGNVGIGTITPTTPLYVASTSNRLGVLDGSSTAGTWWEMRNTSVGGQVFGVIATGSANSEGAGKLLFTKNSGLGSSSGNFMTFDWATTNVGIGVNAPASKLDVNGDIRLAQITAPSPTTDKLYNVGGSLFWNGTNISSGGSGWALGGNAGTVDGAIGTGTNYIGTTDNVPLNFIAFNQKAGRIEVAAANANTLFGYQSGNVNAGIQNAGFGYQSLLANTSGQRNAAFGYQAMSGNTTGNGNTAIGQSALSANSTGGANTAIGTRALANNTASNNTAVGNNALSTNTTSGDNAAVGVLSLSANTAAQNAALGAYSMQSNTSGTNNAGLGYNVLVSNTTGSQNTAIGSLAGYTTTPANANATGSGNTFLGYNTGLASSTQRTNATAIGANAAVNADNSLVLGSINGINGATATVNVGIGISAPTNRLHINEPSTAGNFMRITNTPSPNGLTLGLSGAGSQEAFIANNENAAMYFQTNATNRMAIDATGNVGINKVAPSEKLDVAGNVRFSGALMPNNLAGTSGQVLTSAGPGVPPTWATPSGSTLISNTGVNNLFAGNAFSTGGTDNAIFGANAGTTNTGNYNVILGSFAANAKTTGDLNTIVGWYAGRVASNAGNTLIGAQSGQNLTGGPNTFIGEKSGLNTSTGTLNVFIGNSAAITNTTGDKSTIIGYGADVGSPSLGNANAIGYKAYVTAANSMVLGSINGVNGATASTNVGIGTTAPTWPLTVSANTSDYGIRLDQGGPSGNGLLVYANTTSSAQTLLSVQSNVTGLVVLGNGSMGLGRTPTTNQLEISGNASKAAAGGWLANSDRRIKTDIQDIDNGLELIKKLRPVKYRYTDEWLKRNPSIENKYYYSFIAQELQKVFPESVKGSGEYLKGDKEEILQIDTHNAQMVSIKAIQEQQKVIEQQEIEINALKKELSEIKNYLGLEAKATKTKKGRKK